MNYNSIPAFPINLKPGERFDGIGSLDGVSVLAYIATHIGVSPDLDGIPSKRLASLIGRPLPDVLEENTEIYLSWWMEAEAKLRVMKAKALLAELEKQNP